jgi:ribosomal protein S27AE
MPELTIKDGVLSALVYVQCTRKYVCECGQGSTLTPHLPEGVTVNGQIAVNNVKCPACGAPVVIAKGGRLLMLDVWKPAPLRKGRAPDAAGAPGA